LELVTCLTFQLALLLQLHNSLAQFNQLLLLFRFTISVELAINAPVLSVRLASTVLTPLLPSTINRNAILPVPVAPIPQMAHALRVIPLVKPALGRSSATAPVVPKTSPFREDTAALFAGLVNTNLTESALVVKAIASPASRPLSATSARLEQ
jgi:hypothetical protein